MGKIIFFQGIIWMWIIGHGQHDSASGKVTNCLGYMSVILRIHLGEGKNWLQKVVLWPQCVLWRTTASSPYVHTNKKDIDSFELKYKQLSISILITMIHLWNTKPKTHCVRLLFWDGCVCCMCVLCVFSCASSHLTVSGVMKIGK